MSSGTYSMDGEWKLGNLIMNTINIRMIHRHYCINELRSHHRTFPVESESQEWLKSKREKSIKHATRKCNINFVIQQIILIKRQTTKLLN